MKKICMLLLALSLLTGIKAQNWRNAPKLIVGLRGGASVSNITETDGDTKNVFAFTGGLSASFRIAKIPFYVETGLYYENFGYKDYKTWNDHSGVVPAMISYHAYAGKNVTIQPYMGPSLIFSDELDMGFRMGCGVAYKKFYAGLGLDYNLTKSSGDSCNFNDSDSNDHYWWYDDGFPFALFFNVGVNF